MELEKGHQSENLFKRIMAHNLDKLEKENKPEEVAVVFDGAKNEKVKAIKGGKNVLESNSDILKPRVLEPWKKVTDMVIDKDGNPTIPDKTKKDAEIIERDADAHEELLQPIQNAEPAVKPPTKTDDKSSGYQSGGSNIEQANSRAQSMNEIESQEGFQSF